MGAWNKLYGNMKILKVGRTHVCVCGGIVLDMLQLSKNVKLLEFSDTGCKVCVLVYIKICI